MLKNMHATTKMNVMASASDIHKKLKRASCKIGKKLRTFEVHDPVIECENIFLGKSAREQLRRERKLNLAGGRNTRRNEICRMRTYDNITHMDPISYLNDECPISAAIYQDPKYYEKELWKYQNSYDKYKDRILFTPPMLLERKNTYYKLEPSLFQFSENNSLENPTKSTSCHIMINSEDLTESSPLKNDALKQRPRTRRKGRYYFKNTTSCINNSCDAKEFLCHQKSSHASSKNTFISCPDIDADINFLKKMDKENNNVITDKSASQMNATLEFSHGKDEKPWSIENFSYPPEICPEYFYNWIEQLPIGKSKSYKFDLNNNCDINVYNYDCSIPYECRCQCETKDLKNNIKSNNVTKNNSRLPAYNNFRKNQQSNVREIPNWEIKSREGHLKECPDFHDIESSEFQPKEFAARSKREAMVFCHRRKYAHEKNRAPIFYKLKTTEVKPPSAERDFIWENSVKTLRMAPAKPEKFFIDDRKGTRNNFIRSGLAPIYITGNQFGKIPEYLEERRKAQGLPPCDLSSCRVRKRCQICGHDHAVCLHRKTEQEKWREADKQKRYPFHLPGVVPVYYDDVCCMTTTWGCNNY